MQFQSVIEYLKKSLNGSPLPGREAQLSMAPASRKEELDRKPKGKPARPSAVLILFYPDGNSIKNVFIKRPVDNTVHSGQIAFPGGRYEESDNDLISTALREAHEEVNIEPSGVEVLGTLSTLHIPPSNFDVLPVIGYTKRRPDLKGNEEVDKILEVTLSSLLDPKTRTTKTINHRLGMLVDVPCYFVQGEIIWGATAMMVGELLALLGKASADKV